MIDPTRHVDVSTKKALFINGLHRVRYDECRSFVHTHDRLSISPLGNTTLMVLMGPKAVLTTFVVIPELDLLWVKLGIPWFIAIKETSSILYKCLKFPHKGIVYVV